MDALHVRPLGKSAIGAGNEVLSANQRRQANNALSDQFGMLDNVGDVTDHPRNENLVSRSFDALQEMPLVLMANVGGLN